MDINIRFGDLTITKGYMDDLQINAWDYVRKCKGEKCPIAHLCPYVSSRKKIKEGRMDIACYVERKYLTVILKPFIELLRKVHDPFLMQMIGMHLIPLYMDLVQLKITKLGLENEENGGVTYLDHKGQVRIHPIFEELRRAHREIFSIWKTTGLIKIATDAGFFKNGGLIIPNDDDIDTELLGDASEYEDMASGLSPDEVPDEEKLIRRGL